MTVSAHFSWRKSTLAASLLGGVFVQGCLNYRETATLDGDGTGRIRVEIGVQESNADPEKAREVTRNVKSLRGLHWVSTVDSDSKGIHWYGGELEFDSVANLRPLNTLLPVESLFGSISIANTDSGKIWTRYLRLPTGSKEDHETLEIDWRFPGRILSTDRHAKWAPGSNQVRWSFPVQETEGVVAKLQVRWSPNPLLSPLAEGSNGQLLSCAALAAAIAMFVGSLVLAWLARKKLQLARRV